MIKAFFTALLALALAAAAAPAGAKAQTPDDGIRISATSPKEGLRTLVTLDADDAFLPKILSILGEISGYNIVAGPEVNNRQRISIHLKDSPIEEAVNLVVRAAGLSYEIVGNSFLVTSHANLEQEVGVSSYLIELQFAVAEEVKELLKDLTKNIQIAKGKNALVISTSPKAISEIRKIIEKIDVPSRQIMLETRIIEVSIDKVKELGIDWEKLSKITTILVENPANPALGGANLSEEQLGQMSLDQLPTDQLYERLNGLENMGGYSRQLEAFDVTLDFLMKTNTARLLTDTKITTMNNRKASMHVGEIVPFTIQSQMTAQVERESIGVKIELTPQINSDDFITLTVKPEVSSVKDLIEDRIPNKKIRTAETTVQVKDRQKIVIAGLTNDVERAEVHKVPFLGDLLFVGRFFQHLSRTSEKMDLIVEITPFILNNREDLSGIMPDSLLDLRDSIQKLKDNYRKDMNVIAPTRLCLMPTCYVLKPFQYTVGIHEISIGQFNRLQVFFSPWQNYGKKRLGLKYQLAPTLALSAGYHWGETYGTESNLFQRRLGASLVKGFINTKYFDWNGMGDLDFKFKPGFGDDPRIGLGTGLSVRLGPFIELMGESLNSVVLFSDGRESRLETWTAAAARLRLPWQRNLSFDLGLSYIAASTDYQHLFDINVFNDLEWYQKVFFDLAYSGVF